MRKFLDNKIYLMILLSFFSFVFLFYRVSDSLYYPNVLAEDGQTFFHDAVQMGWRSIFLPYAGYIHLIPRCIAYIYNIIGVNYKYVSILYIFTSFLFCMFCSLLIFKIDNFFTTYQRFFIALSIFISPVNSEVFGSITNIQWVTGITLVYIICSMRDSFLLGGKFLSSLLVLIFSMTGPFASLLLPVAVLRFLYFKDFKSNFHVYFVLFLSSFIQIITLFNYRIGVDKINEVDLYKSLYYFFSNYVGEYFYAFPVWLSFLSFIFIFSLSLFVFYSSEFNRVQKFFIFSLWISYLIFSIISTLLTVDDPSILHAFGVVGRYFYIPNTIILIIIITLFFILNKYVKFVIFILLVSLVIIFVKYAQREPLIDYNWESYSYFIGKVPELRIPINPKGWYIDFSEYNYGPPLSIVNIEPNRSINLKKVNGRFFPVNNDPQIYFDGIACNGEYVLYEADVSYHSYPVLLQMFYSKQRRSFSELDSVKLEGNNLSNKYYFSIPSKYKYLRFDPISNESDFKLDGIYGYCGN